MLKTPTATQNIVNYYAVVFSLWPPDLLRPGRVSQRQNACKNQEMGVCPGAAMINHSAIINSLQVVKVLLIVFLVRPGPLEKVEVQSTECPKLSITPVKLTRAHPEITSKQLKRLCAQSCGLFLAKNSCEKRIWGPELGASLKITLR